MDIHPDDRRYMNRCFQLASNGLGNTGLNPMVGCVIVNNNSIIGEGYHEKYGEAHAEVNAINSVKKKELLSESKLYVNLEPCAHFGKTPPCAHLIAEMKIPEVIIAMNDPNPSVNGSGIKYLMDAGIKVTSGVLESEAQFLNRRFLKNLSEKRPYVILKWAESKDGFIDKIRRKGDPLQPNWITSHTARMLVHKWRSEEYGILAGVDTILADNPSLNVRNWTGRNPVRIIIDRNSRIADNYHVLDDSVPSWVFGRKTINEISENTFFFPLEKEYLLMDLIQFLYKSGIPSMIVEGGARLLNSFISDNLWDEARIFKGTTNFLNGVKAPEIKTGEHHEYTFCENPITFWYNNMPRFTV